MIILILPSKISNSPYLNYYLDIFDNNNVDYRVVYWNRFGLSNDEKHFDKYIEISTSSIGSSKLNKLINYFKFVRKVKKIISKEKCKFIIFFTIPLGFTLFHYLINKFNRRYIFDIRDNNRLVALNHSWLKRLIDNSLLTVISSNGFKNWLPVGNYVLSHNIRRNLCVTSNAPVNLSDKSIIVLTIGQLRDYEYNRNIAVEIAKSTNIKLVLSGFGDTYDSIKDEFYTCENIYFNGSYDKKDEALIVKQSSFINAITPCDTVGKDLITNRFYLAVIYKRPIIVLEGTYQAELVRKYDIGIILNDISELTEEINKYVYKYDKEKFSRNCDIAISDIISDIVKFEEVVLTSIMNA